MSEIQMNAVQLYLRGNSAIDGEIKKQRPAVIVSNDAANLYLSRVQVIPLTSNIDKHYPSEAYVTFEGKKSKVMADLLTTVSKTRLCKRSGIITKQELQDLSKAIRIQLDL